MKRIEIDLPLSELMHTTVCGVTCAAQNLVYLVPSHISVELSEFGMNSGTETFFAVCNVWETRNPQHKQLHRVEWKITQAMDVKNNCHAPLLTWRQTYVCFDSPYCAPKDRVWLQCSFVIPHSGDESVRVATACIDWEEED
jgi:hypothetical protein